MHRIVILGAGYAGMLTAVSLVGRTRRRDDVAVTVVNATDRFTERLRLHRVATGQRLQHLGIRQLVDDLEVGWVTGIDLTQRTVRIDDEREIGYDTLVYPLGGSADTASVPGAADHAYTLDSADGAELFARRLGELSEGRVLVCGGGLTGLEAATEIAERFPQLTVTLLGRAGPGKDLGPKARDHMRSALRRLCVSVEVAEIAAVRRDGATLTGGRRIPADVILMTSGVRVSPLASTAGLTVDDHGRIVTDATLRSVSHPSVYAVGDSAAITQRYGVMHGTCQGGMPTGAHAAAQIARELNGRQPRPFRFGYYHSPISLGRGDAVVQFTHADGSPGRAALTGRAAVWYKETVSSTPWPVFRRALRLPASAMVWRP
ncbi:NAD(P)/FAD-dependent oxidoreductase [Actinoplanes sp. NPDC020271]|uniref:NAD(P)/FAD-dependent oxidoreductase n=1 Tax=Actinoplanes sp. NPDC020271 TaxID=3363896 RepID=UPI00378EB86D